jgi:hypothetical protein
MSHSTEHLYLVSGEEEYDQADKGGEVSEPNEATTDSNNDNPIRSIRRGSYPSSSTAG